MTTPTIPPVPLPEPAVDEGRITIEGGSAGPVRTRTVEPAGATGTLPVIPRVHGAGRVFGDARTHNRLAVVYRGVEVQPRYSRAPWPPHTPGGAVWHRL
ncbi:hypothetical protein [Streptomyces bauhiniae]|uniref:hypothetical protein n=1 Tax=Streptomyces bauhiniae TaxID=2340725 RepID=UPI0035D83C9A